MQRGDWRKIPPCDKEYFSGEFRPELAGATGLEPATFGVTGRRSNQLSYAPAGVLRGPRKGGPMYVPGGRSVKDGRLCHASMYP
jgi:hypothetical protein